MKVIKEVWPSISKGLVSTGIDLLVIGLIFVVAKIALNIVSKITGKTMKDADKLGNDEKSRQIKTSMTVTHSANRYIVYIIAIILSLKVIGLGEEVSSAIVAAGIGGLVLSFGAQSIVKDMLAGLFLLFERQFYVGDYVKINQYEGTVNSIALRVTYLDCAGKRVIIPNGEIRDVVNYSKCDNMAIINVPIPYDADTNKVIKMIQKVVDKYQKEHKDILTDKKAVINGISSLEDTHVIIGFSLETKPLKHFVVQKELLLLIKEELRKNKVYLSHNEIYVKKK